ncbi:MAG TPA: TatD family hydrolase [bacterium]|nr:TatD family hydrolase [bacterium]
MSAWLVDTHAHLDFDQFDADREEVLDRAEMNGVRQIVTIGIDLATSRRSVELAEKYAMVFAAVGIHPHDVAKAGAEDLDEIAALLEHPRVVALGEVGLDFYYNYSPEEVQRKYLRLFLDWSLTGDKPLIIHTRQADEAIVTLLRERSRAGWRGVFHCFSGDARMAEKVLELGFHISFTGNITFKNSTSAAVMREVPLERLMVETDCPFMAPVPHRGRRNEPAYVQLVAQKVAEVKGISFQAVAERTTANARELFHLPDP